jgi:hypothetical protein
MFPHPSILAQTRARAPLSHRKNARKGWDDPRPTRIRLHQKFMPAGRTSTLRKAMRAAGAK